MEHSDTRPRASRTILALAGAILLVLAGLLLAGAWAVPAEASVAHGLAEPNLANASSFNPAGVEAFMQELQYGLRSSYVRFEVAWSQAEPTQGVFDEAYLADVKSVVDAARAHGQKVIITFYSVPSWARDASLMKSVPAPTGVPADAWAPSIASLPYFQAFCEEVAQTLKGEVFGYECWNEPNLSLTLFPQKTPSDSRFGAHIYIKMLRRFSAGIHAADPAALRIAGATAPFGANTVMSTSPQRFAAAIKAARPEVTSLFDAYSHHPYTIGASRQPQPSGVPNDPKTTVSLENLGTLLKDFPTKPFYLTEYGYQTAPCYSFGLQHFSQVLQATYLRQAYSYVRRYPQVKLLMWYLVQDQSPTGSSTDLNGFYTGLRTVAGARKRAWYAFARGDQLTIKAPSSIRRGARVTLTGLLSCRTGDNTAWSQDRSAPAGIADASLTLQRRLIGSRTWRTLKTVRTQADGSYSVTLKPGASAYYRLKWNGVANSASRLVKVR